MGFSKSSSKREVYSNRVIPQETRNVSNRLILHLKYLLKRTKNPQSQQKEGDHKNQSTNN